MKVYRILYERTIVEQMDVPADKVDDIFSGGETMTIRGPQNEVVAVIPTRSLIGCGLIEAPDPAPQAVPEAE